LAAEDEKVSKDDVQRLAPGHVAIPEEKTNPEVLGEKVGAIECHYA